MAKRRPRKNLQPETLVDDVARTFAGKTDRQAKAVSAVLGRHLVCLAFTYAWLDEKGNTYGKQHFYACTAFVIEIDGIWFLTTAGHVLKEDIHDPVKKGQIKILSCKFADYFGMNAKVRIPTPFEYEGALKTWVDDRKIGLDLGLIHLRQQYRDQMAANGVLPVAEENWSGQGPLDFDACGLYGFPSDLTHKGSPAVETDEAMQGSVHPVYISLQPEPNPGVPIPKSILPWFVGRLNPHPAVPDIKGMSGAPIFGFRRGRDGQLRHWIIALQSRWDRDKKIIFGCPVPNFAEIVQALLRRNRERLRKRKTKKKRRSV